MYLQKIIKNLKQEERDALFYAFEQGISYIVIYKPGLFVGVNVMECGPRGIYMIKQEALQIVESLDWIPDTILTKVLPDDELIFENEIWLLRSKSGYEEIVISRTNVDLKTALLLAINKVYK